MYLQVMSSLYSCNRLIGYHAVAPSPDGCAGCGASSPHQPQKEMRSIRCQTARSRAVANQDTQHGESRRAVTPSRAEWRRIRSEDIMSLMFMVHLQWAEFTCAFAQTQLLSRIREDSSSRHSLPAPPPLDMDDGAANQAQPTAIFSPAPRRTDPCNDTLELPNEITAATVEYSKRAEIRPDFDDSEPRRAPRTAAS